MQRTSLDFHSEVIDSIDDDRTEDQDSTEDDADDNDVGQVRLLSRRQQTIDG